MNTASFQALSKIGAITALASLICPVWAQTQTQLDAAAAAAANAASGSECAFMGTFYWEIGDTTKVLASGKQPGTATVDRDTVYEIASGSKWVFGAFALQDNKAKKFTSLTKSQIDKLTMVSGYTTQNTVRCASSPTVDHCLNNATPTASRVGSFYYDGQHLQKLMSDQGYGASGNAGIDSNYTAALGEFGFSVNNVAVAGNLSASAAGYASFLRKIMKNELEMGNQLGKNAVCADMAAFNNVCTKNSLPRAIYSPVNEPWAYSYGHWVERENGSTIDAYSSPGLYGFYPWISPNKSLYGVISRQSYALNAYTNSFQCGRAIRKAYLAALSK